MATSAGYWDQSSIYDFNRKYRHQIYSKTISRLFPRYHWNTKPGDEDPIRGWLYNPKQRGQYFRGKICNDNFHFSQGH